MSYANATRALSQYNQVGNQTAVVDADPHHLVHLLLQGGLDRIAAAKGHMQRGEISEKGAYIGKVISIIDGLRIGLDREAGGDIASNLNELYIYMQQRLLQANIKNDASVLDEVAALLLELKTAWEAIPESAKGLAR